MGSEAVSAKDLFQFGNGDFISTALRNGTPIADSSNSSGLFISSPNRKTRKSQTINQFSVVNDGANDQLPFTTDSKIHFTNGAEYQSDFDAEIAGTTQLYGDLNLGNYTFDPGGFGNANVRFAAVPEPASFAKMGLLSICGAGFAWRKSKKAKAKTDSHE